jgi:hypothetical protein
MTTQPLEPQHSEQPTQATDPPASPGVLGAETTPGATLPPTREELRQKVKAALKEGRITSDDVLADIYASQYNTELTITGMMQMVERLPGFKRMLRKVEKDMTKGQDDGSTEAE